MDNLTGGSSGGGLGFGGTVRATTGAMLTLADWLVQVTNPATFRGVSDTSVAVLYLGGMARRPVNKLTTVRTAH